MGIVPSEHDPEIRYVAVPDPSVGCEVSAVHSGSAARARGEDVLKTVNSGRFMASIPSYIRDGIYAIDDDGGAGRPRRKDRDPEGDSRGTRHRSRDQVPPNRRKGREPVAPAAGPAGTRSPYPRGTPRNRFGPAGRESRSRNRSARVVEIPARGASIDAVGLRGHSGSGDPGRRERVRLGNQARAKGHGLAPTHRASAGGRRSPSRQSNPRGGVLALRPALALANRGRTRRILPGTDGDYSRRRTLCPRVRPLFRRGNSLGFLERRNPPPAGVAPQLRRARFRLRRVLPRRAP